jgi:hypothetical protein
MGFSVMPYYGGQRRTPQVIAAFARFVHERQGAADDDHNHNKDGQ